MSGEFIIKYILINGDRNKKKHPFQATIILILILSNKTIVSLSYDN